MLGIRSTGVIADDLASSAGPLTLSHTHTRLRALSQRHLARDTMMLQVHQSTVLSLIFW